MDVGEGEDRSPDLVRLDGPPPPRHYIRRDREANYTHRDIKTEIEMEGGNVFLSCVISARTRTDPSLYDSTALVALLSSFCKIY